jgi:hypothetical protein
MITPVLILLHPSSINPHGTRLLTACSAFGGRLFKIPNILARWLKMKHQQKLDVPASALTCAVGRTFKNFNNIVHRNKMAIMA